MWHGCCSFRARRKTSVKTPVFNTECRRKGLESGFTLIAILIMGVTMAVAVPRLVQNYNARATSTAADNFVRAHELARATAVRFGRIGEIHIDAANARWYVDVDTSGRGQSGLIGYVRTYDTRGVTMTSTDTLMCFDMRGLRSSRGTCQPGAATVVFSRESRVDSVQITPLGKILR